MYLFYDENNKVNLIYYQEPSQELLQQRYMKVESISEAEVKDGIQSILMCDGKKIWYEYEAVELTETEILEAKLKVSTNRQDFLEELIAEMAMKVYE